MPFELGIDVGCRLFGNKSQTGKKCLVLEAEAYRYLIQTAYSGETVRRPSWLQFGKYRESRILILRLV